MKCPGCGHPKNDRHYVCPSCWHKLSSTTRVRLNLKDAKAASRLHELYRQILHQVPLGEIEVAA